MARTYMIEVAVTVEDGGEDISEDIRRSSYLQIEGIECLETEVVAAEVVSDDKV